MARWNAFPPIIACTWALGIPGEMMGSDLWMVRGAQFTVTRNVVKKKQIKGSKQNRIKDIT
jgi:hypothetical protein